MSKTIYMYLSTCFLAASVNVFYTTEPAACTLHNPTSNTLLLVSSNV